MRKRQQSWRIAVALSLLLASCGRETVGGPPTIHYGQDVCSECGMIISDERFASAIVPQGSDQGPLLFDDVGCMLDYEKTHPMAAAARYVHDATTRKWIAAEQAFFVRSEQQTPMGSGLSALADRAEAQKLAQIRKPSAAKVRTYAELRQAGAAEAGRN